MNFAFSDDLASVEQLVSSLHDCVLNKVERKIRVSCRVIHSLFVYLLGIVRLVLAGNLENSWKNLLVCDDYVTQVLLSDLSFSLIQLVSRDVF